MSNMISENGGCGNDESMKGGEELANGNGRTAAERRRSIRSVIASYEAEEEAFLRELAQMQAECCEESATAAATGGSHTTTNSTPAGLSSNEEDVGLAGQEEEEEEPPAMLGTLCTLIGEIAKLRRENRRLKRRIVVPAGSIEADKQQQQNGAAYSIVSGTEAFGHQLKRALAATGQNRLCSLPRRFFPPAGGCGIIGGGSSGSSAFSCLPLQSSANNSSSCCSSSAAVSGLFARQQSRMPPILMGNRRPQQQQHGGGGSRGAQERLSSPAPSPAALAPNKLTAAGGPSLSVSAYSADLSSDASTFWNRRKPQQQPGNQQQQHPKLLAEPELFDDEWDLEEAEQQAKSTAIAERSTRGMGRRADEQQQRRTAAATANGGGQQQDQQQKQLLRLSSSLTTTASGTSPSAGSSASSSVEPPLNGAGLLDSSLMTSSRSSFLELFGLGGAGSRRRQLQQKQQKKEPSSSPNPFGAAFASAVDSLVARRNRRRRKCVGDGTDAASNRRSAALLFSATGDGEEDGQSPPYSPAHSPYTDGYSSGGIGEQQQQKAAAAVVGTRMESEPNLHWQRNGSSNSSSQQRFGGSRGRRPQSCFLLDPAAGDQKQQQRGQAAKEAAAEDDGSILLRRKSSLSVESMAASRARASRSCRNVAQQNGSQNQQQQQQGRRRGDASGGQQGESAAELRLEMELLKARNARLIEQLREKSSRLSSAEIRQERLARELEQLRRRERFNESVDGLCLRARLALGLERAFGPLEDRLGGQLGAQLQSFKLEAQKQQQMALNAGKQDRQALQEALEQVERLQRQNLSLLQSAAAATAPADLCQSNFELLPSYDALYSFSLGLVKKLGQMRALLAQKCGDEFQAELDLMSSQAQLLLAHAQIERHRLQLELLGGLQKSRRESFAKQRPASFHGDSFLDRLANGRLQLFLPFKLHGQRMLQRKKRHRLGRQDSERRDSGTFDTLVEANEQSIETEFLRLFDSARCLSRICGPSEAAHSHNNSHCAGCASGAAVNSPAGVRRVLASRQQSGSARVGEEAHKMLEESRRCLQRRTQSGGITLSPSAANRSPQMPSASAFHERHSLRRNSQRRLSSSGGGDQHSPALADSPLMKFRRLSAILGDSGGFQQQQLHGTYAEALATSGGSPLAKRTLMPLAGRQIGSQSQLGSQLGHWLSNMEAGDEETAWNNNDNNYDGNGNANANCCSATGRRRPTLVRQLSTRLPPADHRPSAGVHQPPRASSPTTIFDRPRRLLYELSPTPPPLSATINSNEYQQNHQPQQLQHGRRAPSLLRPPTPSAPPMSLVQSSLCGSGQQSADRSPSRWGFVGRQPSPVNATSSTGRPLAIGGQQQQQQAQQQQQPGSRSASLSRLPKAVKHTTTAAAIGQEQRAPPPPVSGPLATSDQVNALPKAVKKAGQSWLSRLRKKSSSTTGSAATTENGNNGGTKMTALQ